MSLLGADLPATLLSGTNAHLASNAKGHWESEPIVRLNDEILHSAGIGWRSPEAMPAQWYQSSRFGQFRAQAHTILESEFGASPLFALKDPRICKLVPFWVFVLEEAAIRPALVTMVRSPEEVADSLLKRNALDRPLGILMWLRYVLAAERDSRTKKRVHLSFDGLLADWQQSAKSIADTFGFSWPSASIERAGQIGAFLSDSDRHHRNAPGSRGGDDVNSWADEACAILNKWCGKAESEGDYAALDAIAEKFEAAVRPLLAPLLVSYEKSASVHKLQNIRAGQHAELERLNEQVRAVEGQLSALADDVDVALPAAGAQTSGVELSQRLGSLAVAIKAQRERRDRADTDLERKNAELGRELAKLGLQNEQATKDSAALAKSVRDFEAQKDARLDKASAELARKENEMAELGARFYADIADLKARETRVHDLLLQEKQQVLAVEAKLAQAQRVNAALLIIRGRFEAASADLAQLGEKLSQTERALGDEKTLAAKRVDELTKKLEQANDLAKSQRATIVNLREDRAAKIAQRDKVQAALVAIHEDRARQVEQRDGRIKELSRNVKRLEKKMESMRSSRYDTGAAPRAAPPGWLGPLKFLSRRLGPRSDRPGKAIELVKASNLFDAEYYRAQHDELRGTPDELLDHYVRHGGVEGHAPSAAFDGRDYLERYPDVAAAGLNPLVHFLERGKEEGRSFTAVATNGLTAADLDDLASVAAVPEIAAEAEVGETSTNGIPSTDVLAGEVGEEADFEHQSDEARAPAIEPSEAEIGRTPADAFSALAIGVSDWLKSSELCDADTLRVGNVAVAVETPSTGAAAGSALRWFDALIGASAANGVDDAGSAVRATLHDGRLTIDDAWLSSDYRLLIRLSSDHTDPLVVRCCQQAEDGSLALCAELPLVAHQSNIVEVGLVSRFAALLLVITDRHGGLVDSTLLPFPTLLRGGVHHGELIDRSNGTAGWAAHQAYAANLLAASVDKSREFAIGGISVALGGANGTEPIFSASFRQWLSRQFKVDVAATVEAGGDNPALPVLAAQMGAGDAPEPNRGRSAGRTLLLGANAIPSLTILLAEPAHLAAASGVRTIVVDDLTRLPLRAVDHPIIDTGPDTLLRAWFAPPLTLSPDEGARPMVVAMRFADEDFRDVRAPFPVAGDVLSAISLPDQATDAPISAIITCTGDVDGVVRLLASLARQQSVPAVECLLTGDVPDLPDDLVSSFHADRLLKLVSVKAGDGSVLSDVRAAVGQATHDRIFLVDDQKVLHDPRTLALLGAMCARDEIGTAGGQIVRQVRKKNGVFSYRTVGGHVPLRREGRPAMVTRPGAGDIGDAPFYPILANPIDCLMARRDLLSSALGGLDEEAGDHRQTAILLGLAIIDGGKLNIATSLVSIADFDEAPAEAAEAAKAPWLAATSTRFLAVEEY
jgi:hypothetical protein